jgi:NAD(P)-dependent dehydrogenase (short-subunit alcohol dehydrogenase family)
VAAARVAGEIGGTAVELDLADPALVRERAAALPNLDVVVANAGVQNPAGPTFTPAGVEQTLAINVLGHVALIDTLLAAPTPPSRAVLLGSGTHDPTRHTGMPAPLESLDLPALALGELTTSGGQRYTTSKLHCTALTAAYARAHPGVHWTCFDPGLMPGTGLARDFPPAMRLVWNTLFWTLTVLPFASTPARSGRALAHLTLDDPPPAPTGTVVDHRLRRTRPSTRAADPAYQDALLTASRAFLARPTPIARNS